MVAGFKALEESQRRTDAILQKLLSKTDHLDDNAKELNMRPSDLEQLAGDNPQLVLSLFQGVEVKSTTPVQTSTVSTPRNSDAPLELPKQEHKIISGGATQEEVMNSWNAAKDYTYKKLGVET